ncbi:MAG: hypothetical protein HZB92_00175 [Euryarchaeota archaeon]|nr:hypothetical protein [Euryarchaeota archaeon]
MASSRRLADELRERLRGNGPAPGPSRTSLVFSRPMAAAFQSTIGCLCSRASRISAVSGMARASASWHLASLAGSGYVDVWETAMGIHYSPCRVIGDPRMAEELAFLLGRPARRVVRSVLERPGRSTLELRSGSLSALGEGGYLRMQRDGRHSHWYPGERLDALNDAIERGGKEFLARLVSLLERDGVAHTISEARPTVTVVLKSPDMEATLSIPREMLPGALLK